MHWQGVEPNPCTDWKRRRILNDAVLACQYKNLGLCSKAGVPKLGLFLNLLDFLDAANKLYGLFSMLFPNSRGGKCQNNHYLFGCEHVDAPLNCGAADLAGPA